MPWGGRIIRSNEKNAITAADNVSNTYLAGHILERAVFRLAGYQVLFNNPIIYVF